MKKLFVYADFDWLNASELIGELSYESIRGTDSYGFKFDDKWLSEYGGIFLSEDLNNFRVYNTRSLRRIFSDAFQMPYPTDGGAHC